MNYYFVLSLVSLLSAIVIIALKVCYASKCENVSICWGLISIEREVSLENKELTTDTSIKTFSNELRQTKILKNSLDDAQHSDLLV